MDEALVECVPNVSEGRRPDVIDRLSASVTAVPGCCLMDVHSDPDHNRSVFTFAGPPDTVAAAAETLATTAVELIDLRVHHGVHPRIGAIDVIPFVPLGTTDMATCVELARRTAQRLAANVGLPSYLYADAAAPGRPRRLAELRAGGFEGAVAAGRLAIAPDFGPPTPHPTAGAVAVGARPPLVAFNLRLTTPDVVVAKAIAARVREAGGGLHGVQALGLSLASRNAAQVSMNLLDPAPAALVDAVVAVRGLAREMGTDVAGAELVGLAPSACIAALAANAVGGVLEGVPGLDASIEARLEDCAR